MPKSKLGPVTLIEAKLTAWIYLWENGKIAFVKARGNSLHQFFYSTIQAKVRRVKIKSQRRHMFRMKILKYQQVEKGFRAYRFRRHQMLGCILFWFFSHGSAAA